MAEKGLSVQAGRWQPLRDVTLPAPPRSAPAGAARRQHLRVRPRWRPGTRRGTTREREGGLKLGTPGLARCSRSTSLPAGHDHAVIGVLAMNSAEKGESASENLQLSSHF